jgi:hypothetical protein
VGKGGEESAPGQSEVRTPTVINVQVHNLHHEIVSGACAAR